MKTEKKKIILIMLIVFVVCGSSFAVQTIYVDSDAPQFGDGTSWATAFNYLQDALADANSNSDVNEIRVAQGIYKPDQGAGITPGDQTTTFQLINGVTIKGGYAGLGQPDPDARDISLYETILSGDMNGDDEPNFVNNGDNSLHVVTGSSTNATAVLDGFTVTAGNADSYDDHMGAGMYNEHGSPTLIDCTFAANYAGDDDGGSSGGGMYNLYSNPTLTRCMFVGNYSLALDGGEGHGGAIRNDQSNAVLTDCSFIDNYSGHDGGAMYNSESDPVLTDCTFTGNSATKDGGGSKGGAIYNNASDPVLTNCTFTGNFVSAGSKTFGGAIYNRYGSRPVLIDCTFVGNYAEGGWEIGRGGAVYGERRTILSLTDCSFRENSAWHGGAIYIQERGGLTLDGCTFIDNTAAGILYGGGRGGGVYSQTDAVSMLACTFQGNSSEYEGGGVYSEDASLLLTECTFIANVGRDYHDAPGGGIDIDGPEAALFRCTFSENTASYGGGLAAGPNTLVVNSTFIGNTVHEGGGALVSGDGLTLINCTITGNSCDWFGSGGIENYGDVDVILVNSILWGNSLNGDFSESSQIDGDNAVISYSCVQGWTGQFGGVGNFGSDPMFVDADGDDDVFGTEDDNLRLLLDSPCIDTGDNAAVPPSVLTDLDGNPRIIGDTVDMGAFEFSGPVYVDDDAQNDPGPGDPQVSDPLENGTKDQPFDTIQEAIDVAVDGYTVLVRQGSYFEPAGGSTVDFLGKNISLKSEDPTDWDIIDNTIVRGYVQFSGSEDPNCTFAGFKIRNLEGAIYGNHTHATISHCNISGNGPCGATVIKDCDGTISNCLITDNLTFFYCGVYPVVFGCNGLIKNCTIANNLSGVSVGTATIQNCIIYNNAGSQLDVGGSETLNISYCNLQGGLEGITGAGSVNWGPGNIDTDPCFVRAGYWDGNPLELIEGDYHLRSEGWRWNTDSNSWTYDYITSRSIDAGNPGSPLDGELMSVPRDPDNTWGVNLRINMGAFGGTGQAGMPPHDWALLPDLNNDGIVNYLDFAYQAQDWQATAPEQPGDQNRDGVVNKIDLARLANDWLKKTTFFIPEPDVPTGSLRVVILPGAVIAAGAQWRVDSGTWHDSTYTKTGLSAGPHTLEYKHIFGWNTPPTETVQIELSQTTTRVGTYVPYVDVTPPAPVPAIISIQVVSPSSISMISKTVYDESGVQYYFEARSPGGHDSGWLDEPNYTDVSLVPDTTYCYRVKARDKSVNSNETIWSPQVCTATPPPDILAPLPDPMQWDPFVDANGYDGRPREVYLPIDDLYGATMRAIDANDVAPPGVPPSEVEYYFECQDDSRFDSGWRTVALYPNETVRRTYTVPISQYGGNAYDFRVRARDASDNLNMTDWSVWYPAWDRPPP